MKVIDEYINKLTPATQQAAAAARAWGERVCARLDRIAAAVESESALERRNTYTFIGTGAVQDLGSQGATLEVPVGQAWLLEWVNVSGTPAGRSALIVNGRTAWSANGTEVNGSPSILLTAGTMIQFLAPLNAEVYMTVRRRIPKYNPMKSPGGSREVGSDREGSEDTTGRHVSDETMMGRTETMV